MCMCVIYCAVVCGWDGCVVECIMYNVRYEMTAHVHAILQYRPFSSTESGRQLSF